MSLDPVAGGRCRRKWNNRPDGTSVPGDMRRELTKSGTTRAASTAARNGMILPDFRRFYESGIRANPHWPFGHVGLPRRWRYHTAILTNRVVW